MHRAYGLLLYRKPNSRVTEYSHHEVFKCQESTVLRFLCWLLDCGSSASFYVTNRQFSDPGPLTDLDLIKNVLADGN